MVMYLQEKYQKEIVPFLKEKLKCANPMLIPRLEKIVVNSSTGDAIQNPKVLGVIAKDIETITGQKTVVRKSKKSISNFKLREGQPIAVSVTLRGKRMYEFFSRLVNFAMPRIRDFKGFSKKAFDGHGNYALGLSEQIIFAEINPDKVEQMRGMNICIKTTTDNDAHAQELLGALGFPFRN
ncbi:MAG: 50S ribosomal protein L5 [Deltaproteobacteria bacterium]|nr:50S ribosomal protein L5 [Deltaproteobacteria bacterium]